MTVEQTKARLAWWNTRLTPPKGTKLKDADRVLVLEMILLMLLDDTDIICLGEIDTADAEWLSMNIGEDYRIFDFSRSPNGRKFNIAAIVRASRISIKSKEFLISAYGGSSYKIGVRLDCVIDNELNLDLFVVHWASRIYKEDGSSERDFFGHTLRQDIDSRAIDSVEKNTIIIGDFNDEPYNRSVTKTLRVSRDASHAAKSRDILYNPFWKRMACSVGYERGSKGREPTGTYFHSANKLNKWLVLDQVLFSPSFIGRGDWHLSELRTDVWRPTKLVDAVEGSWSSIDHLPIKAEIQKEVRDG